MKADTYDLRAIFGRPVNYLVPLYQRPYVWTLEKQWEPLWEDVREVAERQLDGSTTNDDIPHFMGAIVLERSLLDRGLLDGRTVIDGQQRLTTLQLLIAAARSLCADHGQDSLRRQFETLLVNDRDVVRGDGDPFKVTPTNQDRAPFREIMEGGIAASTGSHRMHDAYRYFRGQIAGWLGEAASADEVGVRLEKLGTVLWKRLVVVQIDLGAGDNAQAIFETMNALMTPILPADLVKNHLFQTATIQGARIDDLYERYWKTLDTDWWREEIQQGRLKRPRLDTYINHWLAMAGDEEVVSSQLFPEFKKYLAAGSKSAADVLMDLQRYAHVYETFENEPRTTELGRFLYRLGTMEVTTAYPALLWLLGPDGLENAAERNVALDAIESWLVRRMLVRGTTKNYNVVFLALLKRVREVADARGSRPLGSDVVEFLSGLSGESQVWPHAAAVRAALRALPAYSVFPRSRLRMVLESLEQALYTGLTEQVVLPTDLTIEHVLPQDWSTNWPLPQDVEPNQGRLDRDLAKHRLGNLTLITGKLNSKQSNSRWEEKRQLLREHAVMRISNDIKSAETWDEAAIAARGDRLADIAVGLWQRPDDDHALPGPATSESPAAVVPAPGPPDTDNPAAFASVFAIADEIGIGAELRSIVNGAREMGLYPRPDRYSVMVSPPADKRTMLFTVWPQWEQGGSFRIWKSPVAFAKYVPGVTLDAAQKALGASEEAGVLPAYDTEGLLSAVRALIPEPLTGVDGMALEDEDSSHVPDSVHALIRLRAAPAGIALSEAFAEAAAAIPGTRLKVQRSTTGDPWYYRIRHPKFGQAVAYIHPKPTEVYVEYRLLPTHDTYGLATPREHFYGLIVRAHDDAELEVAIRLLNDAIARDD